MALLFSLLLFEADEGEKRRVTARMHAMSIDDRRCATTERRARVSVVDYYHYYYYPYVLTLLTDLSYV